MIVQLPTHYGPLPAAAVHALFEAAAFMVGGRIYCAARRRAHLPSALEGPAFWILAGCIFGAALGNKLVFLIEVPELLARWREPAVWFAGQSIVGGLLGGLVGVELAKRAVGVRTSTGDQFVVPILAGLALGRIGCFLGGLADGTYGVETSLPWAVDFGDGVARHPTQLYEILFCLLLLALLPRVVPAVSGLRFKALLCAYLVWRLAIDGLKPVPHAYLGGLSGIQLVAAGALLAYLPITLRHWRTARA